LIYNCLDNLKNWPVNPELLLRGEWLMSQETFRKNKRQETKQTVRCKTSHGGAELVWMLDLSPTGCQVMTQHGRLRVGESVIVRPQGLEGIPGFVRWSKADRAGIEFSPPLHPSVADHVAKMNFVEEDTNRRRVFGSADHLGRRFLPKPTVSIVRSVL
jgi:hypothetical protein